MQWTSVIMLAALVAACETQPPAGPDFSGHLSFDLGPPFDLPAPYGFDANVLPAVDPHGTIVFAITDSESGALLPARVVFRPPPGAGFADSLVAPAPLPMDPPLPGSATGATVSPGVVGAPEGVLLQSGWGEVQLPPGDYELFVTRGPAYEARSVAVHVVAGVEHGVNVGLARSVDTRGWMSADMHIHSGLSFDSKIPLDRRAISMVTNGVEILVPTEHHGSFSFAELLPQLGYGSELAGSIAGNELNFKEGHAGVYPVPYDPLLPHGGSPPYQNLNPQGKCDQPQLGTNCYTAGEAFPMMRALRQQGSVVTINHPWFGTSDLGYFTNIGWGAGTGAPFPVPLPIMGKFDAIEIINGYWTEPNAEAYLLADWFYLLAQGQRVTALGNSDTHKINWVRGGWPRTYLRLPIDKPGEITDQLLADAIRNQRAIATTGPFVTLEVEHGQIGDTVQSTKRGSARVHIVADAPTWISLDEVILFINGRERRRFKVSDFTRPRFSIDAVEAIEGDSFFVVLATGNTPLPGDVVGEYSEINGYRMLPWAVTNPVYVDDDGDGELHFDAQIGPALPWLPPQRAGTSDAPQALGYGASRPAGPECDPRVSETTHARLEALSDLVREATPLLYP